MTPRSWKTSSVRGWIPFPREPAKGVLAVSTRRKAIDRRASSMANVRPVGPAPTMRTSVSYIVRITLIVHCTNVNHPATEQGGDRRRCPCDCGCRGICGGLNATNRPGTWGGNDESLLLREVEGRADLCDGRRAHG